MESAIKSFMDSIEQINHHLYLSLIEICEPADNVLKLLLAEAKMGGLNESYTYLDKEEEFEGRLACIYTKSRFLDYVRISTLASDEYPGPFKHYGFNCLNHIVDIVSADPPKIVELRFDR